MQKVSKQLLDCYRKYNPVHLIYPFSSRKSFVIRAFFEELLQSYKNEGEIVRLFLLYSGAFPEKNERSVKAIYTKGIKDDAVEGWYDCEFAVKKLFPQLSTQPYLSDFSHLQDNLRKQEYELIIVVDDYEQWREGKSDSEFSTLSELKDKNTRFLLITQQNLPSRLLENEKNFLGITGNLQYKPVQVGLPSPDEAKEMIESLWRETKQAGVSLSDEHLKQIINVTGRYPLLMETLIKVLAIRKQNIVNLEQSLERAQEQDEFRESLDILWNSLDDLEKNILALVAICQKSGRSLDEAHDYWDRFSRQEVPKLREVRSTAKRLHDEKFLLSHAKKADEYIVTSSALLDTVLVQDNTKTLIKTTKMLVENKREWFSSKKFLGLWLISAFLYFIFLIIQQVSILKKGSGFSDLIGLAVWMPPFLYYFVNVFKLFFRSNIDFYGQLKILNKK